MFDPAHYRLIGGSLIHCFPHKPRAIRRVDISNSLKEIREFRNRVYHNEPICFAGNTIDYTVALNIRDDIYQLLDWIDPELRVYVSYYDNVDIKIARTNSI